MDELTYKELSEKYMMLLDEWDKSQNTIADIKQDMEKIIKMMPAGNRTLQCVFFLEHLRKKHKIDTSIDYTQYEET
jgi:hypothetical protein